jgi:hypothetical protein
MRFIPVSPERLAGELAELLLTRSHGDHPLRVALDGPRCAELGDLATSLGESLAAAGRPVATVSTEFFYRDASLRFEYGKTDIESFYTSWLDVAAVQREVLSPLGPGGTGLYLPSMRDPATNRSTRQTPKGLAPRGFLLVHGELLLGAGLSFDLSIHATVSRQARRRQTIAAWAWTLPAFDRYDLDVEPETVADVVLRYDDPKHPAMMRR